MAVEAISNLTIPSPWKLEYRLYAFWSKDSLDDPFVCSSGVLGATDKHQM